jgi:hypothetical protein
MKRDKIASFLTHVADADFGCCWNWIGSKTKAGYGQSTISRTGVRTTAHRVSWELYIGPIPDSLMVLHEFDNRSCVNPSHLFLGTQTDNMRDAAAKGRISSQVRPQNQPRGDNHHLRKRTHCKNGHKFTEETTVFDTRGTRLCSICIAVWRKNRTKRPYVRKRERHYNQEKTHCIHGHEFTADNTYVRQSTGQRSCKLCRWNSYQKMLQARESKAIQLD